MPPFSQSLFEMFHRLNRRGRARLGRVFRRLARSFGRGRGGLHRSWAKRAAAAVFFAAVCGGPGFGFAQAAADPPNVVMFLVDDMGWVDHNVTGANPSTFYESPNLQRLANEGMYFTDYYCPSPVCSPTRASLLTGYHPARTHLTQFLGAPQEPDDAPFATELDGQYVTLAEALGAAGYATATMGKWHLGEEGTAGADPTQHGFDVNVGGWHWGGPYNNIGNWQSNPDRSAYFADADGSFGAPNLGPGTAAPGTYITDELGERAAQYVTDRAANDEPFFLYMSHYGVHWPWQAKQSDIDHFQEKLNNQGGDPRGHDDPVYAAMLKSVDDALGQLLDRIEDPDGNGLTDDSIADETVVIFSSDNGGPEQVTENSPLRAHKGHKYEGGTRVPAVVRWPGRVSPGATSDELVTATDWYPTVLEMTGVAGDAAHNADFDGDSVLPILEQSGTLDRPIYVHYPNEANQTDSPHSWIRVGDHKLIQNYDAGMSIELYDLAADLGETTNLTGSQPELASDLQDQLHDWLVSVGANLPPGVILGDPPAIPLSIVDGGFEGGDGDGQPTLTVDTADPARGWFEAIGNPGGMGDWAEFEQSESNPVAPSTPDGTRWGALGSQGGGRLYQRVGSVEEGMSYTISGRFGRQSNADFDKIVIELWAFNGSGGDGVDLASGGVLLDAIVLSELDIFGDDPTDDANDPFLAATAEFEVTLPTGSNDGEALWLAFADVNTPGDLASVQQGQGTIQLFDGVQIVPEPSTAMLLVPAGLLALRRARRGGDVAEPDASA